ncbi:hypothetical protein ACN27F_19690 [Solwaraspora sp. WMMB335]|uniref:hypothetical protein n=1 Tax=Solwaraspora sp. WMMB335 TaxID=3404118 RepID=UPI003B958DA0
MFGLRAQLPAAITLGEVATKMQALAQLIRQLAAVEPLQQASLPLLLLLAVVRKLEGGIDLRWACWWP